MSSVTRRVRRGLRYEMVPVSKALQSGRPLGNGEMPS